MVLKVQCPNNSEECSVVGGEIMESMLLLGDNEQTMQCLSCGFGSSNKMKSDNYQPNEFKDICKARVPIIRAFSYFVKNGFVFFDFL